MAMYEDDSDDEDEDEDADEDEDDDEDDDNNYDDDYDDNADNYDQYNHYSIVDVHGISMSCPQDSNRISVYVPHDSCRNLIGRR